MDGWEREKEDKEKTEEFPLWLSGVWTWLVSMKMWFWSLASLSRLRLWCFCCVGHRCGSDPLLLWLWRRLAGVGPIQSLAWELPYAAGAALKNQIYICVYKHTHTHTYIYIHTHIYIEREGERERENKEKVKVYSEFLIWAILSLTSSLG